MRLCSRFRYTKSCVRFSGSTYLVMPGVDDDVAGERLSANDGQPAALFGAPAAVLERIADDGIIVETRIEMQCRITRSNGLPSAQQVGGKPAN